MTDLIKARAREKLNELYLNYLDAKELDFDKFLTAKLYYSFIGGMELYEATFKEVVYHNDLDKELSYELKREETDNEEK